MKVTVDAKRAIAALLELRRRADNLGPALRHIADLGLASIRQNFHVGGRPKWAPLKAPRVGGGRFSAGRILVKSGALQSSIQYNIASNTITWQTGALKYAAIHQFGGRISLPEIRPVRARVLSWEGRNGRVFAKRVRPHTVTIPARPYMVFQPADHEAFAATLSTYLLKGLER